MRYPELLKKVMSSPAVAGEPDATPAASVPDVAGVPATTYASFSGSNPAPFTRIDIDLG